MDLFIPNDTFIADGSRVALITGANCSGKSVYLKQVSVYTQVGRNATLLVMSTRARGRGIVHHRYHLGHTLVWRTLCFPSTSTLGTIGMPTMFNPGLERFTVRTQNTLDFNLRPLALRLFPLVSNLSWWHTIEE